VSWQLVSFLILVGVLVAGFAWYERSRPASQVVALVAALAALAIAGRIAFAAFPNVKPTTDIVIFAGYALGPAPGFAVGALSGLVSNFWFGQGPWTPWQMAGWGLCGILGAALALWPRRLDRFTLAAVCGLAAVGYGALQNFSLMATYGGDLSWKHFWVLEGRAVPFEIAHAAGNVALALVAGPAMIRMLVRFRRRFEWERGVEAAGPPPAPPGGSDADRSAGPGPEPPPARRPALGTGSVAAVLVAVLLVGAFASARAEAAAGNPTLGAVWLARQQNPDGGWGASPGDDSAEDMTGWAMLGLEAAATNPLDVNRGGKTGVDFLRGEVSSLTTPGDLARTVLALEGAGVDPREFGGANLVQKLLARQRADGSYQGWPGSTAYAVVALRAAGASGVSRSLEWLREAQNPDGGWGDTANSPSDADATGAVLQAMSPTSKASDRGVNYLNQTQQKGGGWRLGGSGALNTQSTSWAGQGLLAAGANPSGFKRGGASPYDYLAANQESDGSYRYSNSSDQTPVWVTGQVIVAAAEGHLPLPAPKRIPQPKTAGPPTSSSAGGAVPPTPLPESNPLPESGAISPPFPGAPSSGGSPSPAGNAGKTAKHAGSDGKKKGAAKGSPGGLPSGKPGQSTPPAAAAPEGAEESEPAGGEAGAVSPGAEPEEPDEGGSSSSVAGSILAGALAGCLLFAIGWTAWRFYLRRRYGR
jgi:energy-coupling factor transport system substrate-specific component